MKVLKVDSLIKIYGDKKVLDNVTMEINEGEIYGLLGRNGAGKTTLMKSILGLTDITSGSITLWGENICRGNENLYHRIGTHLDLQGFYPNLSAYENIMIFSSIRGITRNKAIKYALEQVGLIKEKDVQYKKFSLGMKKRLALANAIIHEPEFLILDEPINGLDPIGIVEFREYLMKINKENNITIMISSHILAEISAIASMVGILENGKMITEKTMKEVKAYGRRNIKISVTNINVACNILEEKCNISDFEVLSDKELSVFDLTINIEMYSKELLKHGVGILDISVIEDGLEKYFKDLVSKS